MAHFCVVSSLADGMNLVAKEFVASRDDEDGVLVLSALAGAAEELREALIIDPYDVDGFANALTRAIDMDPEERRLRMKAMRRIVAGRNVFSWASDILEGLESLSTKPSSTRPALRRVRPSEESSTAFWPVVQLLFEERVAAHRLAPFCSLTLNRALRVSFQSGFYRLKMKREELFDIGHALAGHAFSARAIGGPARGFNFARKSALLLDEARSNFKCLHVISTNLNIQWGFVEFVEFVRFVEVRRVRRVRRVAGFVRFAAEVRIGSFSNRCGLLVRCGLRVAASDQSMVRKWFESCTQRRSNRQFKMSG